MKANYEFEKRLPDYIIQNIIEEIFENTKIYGGVKRIYEGAWINSPSPNSIYFGPTHESNFDMFDIFFLFFFNYFKFEFISTLMFVCR